MTLASGRELCELPARPWTGDASRVMLPVFNGAELAHVKIFRG